MEQETGLVAQRYTRTGSPTSPFALLGYVPSGRDRPARRALLFPGRTLSGRPRGHLSTNTGLMSSGLEWLHFVR